MKDRKKVMITVILASVVFIVTGLIIVYTCYHRWNDATCTEPNNCSICGKTEGEPLGHKWSNATCVKPQTCKVYNDRER